MAEPQASEQVVEPNTDQPPEVVPERNRVKGPLKKFLEPPKQTVPSSIKVDAEKGYGLPLFDSSKGTFSDKAMEKMVDDMVAQGKLPNNPKVLQAILDGNVPVEKVAKRHQEFLAKNPVATIDSEGQVNTVKSLTSEALKSDSEEIVGKLLYSSPSGDVYKNFDGGFAATSDEAYKQYEKQLNSTVSGQAQLLLAKRKSEGRGTDPLLEVIARPEIGKSFLGGASFGIYDPKIDDLTPEQAATVKGLDVAGGLAMGFGIGALFSKIPLVAKLASQSEALGETISALKNSKIAAKAAGLTEEAAQIGSSLRNTRIAKAVTDFATVIPEAATTGAAVGGAKSALQRNSVKDILIDAGTEALMFSAFGAIMLPLAEGAGALFSRGQRQRTERVLSSVAKQPEIQALAAEGATPGFLKNVKDNIGPIGPYTPQQQAALSAIQKIEATNPLLGTQAALLGNPEILIESFDQTVKSTSKALFGEGGPFNQVLGLNPYLKTLFDSGKHREVLDSAQALITEQISKNPEAKEHILAPFMADSMALNKVYANRMLKNVKTPDAYPNLQRNLLNYLSDKSPENALLLQQSSPKGFMRRVQSEKYFDARLNSKEVDSMVGDIFHEALHTLSGKVKEFAPSTFGKFQHIDDILKSTVTFNKELNRGFIEAYATNPVAFDDNFIQVNPELLQPTKDAVNLKRIFNERNITLTKRREINAAIQDIEQTIASTSPKATPSADGVIQKNVISSGEQTVDELKTQLISLKDKRRVLNIVFANQNRDITRLTTILDRMPSSQKQELDQLINQIHVPRRQGQAFGAVLDSKMEIDPQARSLRKNMASAESDVIRKGYADDLNNLTRSDSSYIESSQKFQGKFGAGDNPYFIRAGSELADVMNSFMVTGTDIRDLNKIIRLPFGVNIENPRRLLQKEFGTNNVFEKLISNIKNRDSLINSKATYWAKQFDNIGIRAGSKESALLQKFGEGRLKQTDAEFMALSPNIQEKIIKGNKVARDFYDGTLDAINDTMRRNGLPEIPKMPNFYTHFQETMDSIPNQIKKFLMGDVSDIDFTGKGGRMFWKSKIEADPNRTVFRSEKKRSGNEFIDDAITGMKSYVRPSLERIYYTDVIREIDTARHFAPDNLGEFLQGIKDKYLLKLPNSVDQATGSMTKQAMNWVRARMGKGAILFNANVAMQQLLSMPQNFAIGPMHGMKAMTQMFSKEGGEIAAMSKNLLNRDATFMEIDKEASLFESQVLGKLGIGKMNSNKITVAKDKAGEYWEKMGGFAMKTFDRVAAKHAYLTGYSKARSMGLSKDQAATFGDKWLEMVQNDMTRISQPEFYQSVVGKSLAQFQSFMTNFAAGIMNDLPKIASTEGGAKAVGMIVKSVAGMSLANETARSIGIPAPFDLDTFVPFLGSYRFGPPGMLSLPYNFIEAGVNWAKGDERGLKRSKRKLMQTGMSMAFPGGGQASKTMEAYFDKNNPGSMDASFSATPETPKDKSKAREKKLEAKINSKKRYRNSESDPYGGTKTYVRDLIFGSSRNDGEDDKTAALKNTKIFKLKTDIRMNLTGEKDKRKRKPPWLGKKRANN